MKLLLWLEEKDWVPLYYSGWTTASIHGRDPTTERHGGFDLLRFRPGPVHPSLGDLVVPGSPRSTISIPSLVRTPDRHSPLQPRTPELKRSASLSLPVAWITGTRHRTRRLLSELVTLLSFRNLTSLLSATAAPSGKKWERSPSIHPSIHPFSIPASYQFWVAGVCWSLCQSLDCGRKYWEKSWETFA